MLPFPHRLSYPKMYCQFSIIRIPNFLQSQNFPKRIVVCAICKPEARERFKEKVKCLGQHFTKLLVIYFTKEIDWAVLFETHIVQGFIQRCFFFSFQWSECWSIRGFRVFSSKPVVCRGLKYWLMFLLSRKDRGQSHSWRLSLMTMLLWRCGNGLTHKKRRTLCLCLLKKKKKTFFVRLPQMFVKHDNSWLYCKNVPYQWQPGFMESLLVQKY